MATNVPPPPPGFTLVPPTPEGFSKVDLSGVDEFKRRLLAKQLRPVNADMAQTGPVQAADDVVRLLANGMTFGFADKGAAALNQMTGMDSNNITDLVTGETPLSRERAKTQAARDRAGTAAIPAEILGSVLTGSGLTGAGLTASAIPRIGGIIGPTVDGAAYGAANALGNDQSVTKGALTGGAFGLAGQLAGKAIEGGYKWWKGSPNVPSLDELTAQKNAAYSAVDASGAQYAPEQLAALRQGIADDMSAGKMHPAINPKVSAVNDIVGEDLGRGPMTLSDLDRTRQVVGQKIFQNGPSPDDARLGGQMLQNFDEFIGSTPPAVGGDNADAVKALMQARELNKRVAKTNTLESALDRAERQAAVTGSGGNIDNATRQKINALLNSKQVKQFSPDEQEMMRQIAFGTKGANAMRLAGKLSPSGNGLMAALNIGATMANPAYGIPGMIGIGAKAAADRNTRKLVENLIASAKTGGNYKPPEMSPQAREKLAALLKALSMAGTSAALQGQ